MGKEMTPQAMYSTASWILASLPAQSDIKTSTLGGAAASVSGIGCIFSIAASLRIFDLFLKLSY